MSHRIVSFQRILKLSTLFISLGLLLTSLLLSSPEVSAQVPRLIRYQGQAVDSAGVPLEGPYTLTFRLYDAAAGGTKVWEEQQTNVSLQGGHFSVLLGSVTPLDGMGWDEPCWLAVQVNGETEFAPRQQITSVPAAMTAERLSDSHTISPQNLLKNRRFELWKPDGALYAHFSGWYTYGANYGIARQGNEVARFGTTAAKLIYDGGGHFGNVYQRVDDVGPLRGHPVTFSVWTYAPKSDGLFFGVEIEDGVRRTYYPRVSLKTATWELFTFTHVVDPLASQLECTFFQSQPDRPPSGLLAATDA